MARIVGTMGNDDLIGTEFEDRFFGLGGSDVVEGDLAEYFTLDDMSYSWDTVTGRNDRIEGNRGDDTLLGEAWITFGETSGEELEIVGGDDRIQGGKGDDNIYGDGIAQNNWDVRFTGGYDRLMGGAGNDIIVGDGGAQSGMGVYAVAGKDRIVGGTGDDTLIGDFHVIEGEWSVDVLETAGDIFVFHKGSGKDIIQDFVIGEDLIELSGLDWEDLDTRGRNDELTGRDHAVRKFSDDTYFIDLGRAAGNARGEHVLEIQTEGTLTIDDFLFA